MVMLQSVGFSFGEAAKDISVKTGEGSEEGPEGAPIGVLVQRLALGLVSRGDGLPSPSSACGSSCWQVSLLATSGKGAQSYRHPATGSFGSFVFSSLHQAGIEHLLCA